jgi:hypothetical protein
MRLLVNTEMKFVTTVVCMEVKMDDVSTGCRNENFKISDRHKMNRYRLVSNDYSRNMLHIASVINIIGIREHCVTCVDRSHKSSSAEVI